MKKKTLVVLSIALSLAATAGVAQETSQKAAPEAPCSTEPYRQFDFWLGDFRVEDPKGRVVGENQITGHLDGCMVMESWTSASGMRGMSMNYYDPADETWNQIFIDNRGKPGNWPPLKGKLEENGAMVLWSPEAETRFRWTWTAVGEGKVRQMAEQTDDSGKTWKVIWDSYYVPKSTT